MVFHWGLSYSKSPQVSRTLLSILAECCSLDDFNLSSNLIYNWCYRRVYDPQFVSSLARSKYLSLFLLSLIFRRVFTNGSWERGSIPGQILTKTQYMVLDAALLYTPHYKVGVRVKLSNPVNGVAPFPTTRCGSYWKGALRVTHD